MNVSRSFRVVANKNCNHLCKFSTQNEKLHPFAKKSYTSFELSTELTRNQIYNSNGLLVLNKPQGISFAENSSSSEDGNYEVSLHTLLPFLKEKLNVKKIYPAKVPEKHASGVAVFCTDEKLLKRVKKCFQSMRGQKIPAETYECIVLGKPTQEFGQYLGGITVETNPKGNKKGIKFIQECSKSSVRNGLVKNVFIENETMYSNEIASRLRISITRTKWHALRVYTATQLVCPILGDRVFGGLVKTVLGRQILLDMWSPAASQPSKPPKELLSKLKLASREDLEIPLHLHLWKVRLMNFPQKGKNMEFTAEPPDFFKWTCSQLNLEHTPYNSRLEARQ